MSGVLLDVVLALDPNELENPDLDLRYRVAEEVVARTSGRCRANGYDYQGDLLLLFFLVRDEEVLAQLVTFLQTANVLRNPLAHVRMATRRSAAFEVVHPPNRVGERLQVDSPPPIRPLTDWS